MRIQIESRSLGDIARNHMFQQVLDTEICNWRKNLKEIYGKDQKLAQVQLKSLNVFWDILMKLIKV